jgi:hypothetical protein
MQRLMPSLSRHTGPENRDTNTVMRPLAILLSLLCFSARTLAEDDELRPLAETAVAWWYNHAGAPPLVRMERVVAALQYAAGGWKPCGVAMTYAGEAAARPGIEDEHNVIGWSRLPDARGISESGAAVVPWLRDRQTVEVDIILEPRIIRTVSELRFVLTHELGHALGLGHSAEPDSIMRSIAYSHELDPRPSRLDLRNCQALYH